MNLDVSDSVRAETARAAHDAGRTANDFGVLKFAAGTTHSQGALPASFAGRWVIMYATGGVVHYAFSLTTGREVDTAAAAGATTGTADKVGAVLADGLNFQVRRKLPAWAKDETCFFVREASASATVYMELSDPP